MKKKISFRALISAFILLAVTISGCQIKEMPEAPETKITVETSAENETNENGVPAQGEASRSELIEALSSSEIEDKPKWDGGSPFVEINNGTPFFSKEDIEEAKNSTQAGDLSDKGFPNAWEFYSELDGLGRCGYAEAVICSGLMPTEKRESISSVHPSGWNNKEYSFVDGGWLYNRCHLIGFQLAGENANEKNLITGTRYMNTQGMLPFENIIADYVKEEGDRARVLYRVTPIYEEEDLVAKYVLMEAYSANDSGESICFCVLCFNAQPGVEIDYATGESWEIE